MARRLTHLDESGRPRMVDITAKAVTARQAIAKGSVYMKPQTLALIRAGQVAKGDVISVAQVARVDGTRCTGCGRCVAECPRGALGLHEA